MQVSEYMVEQAMKEQEKIDQSLEIDARSALLFDSDAGFGAKFEAVMTDLLEGRHTTQIKPDDPGMYREPTDNGEDPEEPTKDF